MLLEGRNRRTLSGMWRLTAVASVLAALVLCLVQLSFQIIEFDRISRNAITSSLSMQKYTAKMAIEFLDKTLAQSSVDALITSSIFQHAKIVDDFGRTLASASSDKPITSRFSQVILGFLGVVPTKNHIVILDLSNGKSGLLKATSDMTDVFDTFLRRWLDFTFLVATIPILVGYLIQHYGIGRIRNTFTTLSDWAGQNTFNTEIPLPDARVLVFDEIVQFGKGINKILKDWREQIRQNEVNKQQIIELSNSDPLTGCRNRRFLEGDLAHNVDKKKSVGVAFLDIDDFKFINGRFGHDAGDLALKKFASILLNSTPIKTEDDHSIHSIIRMGGDEFLLVSASDMDADSLEVDFESVLQKIHKNLASMRLADSSGYELAATIVFFVAEVKIKSLTDLVADTSTAISRVKQSHKGMLINLRNGQPFSIERQRILQRDFGPALERGEIIYAFQPIYDLASIRVSGFEALLRWRHPTLGPVSPEEFVQWVETGSMSRFATPILIEKFFSTVENAIIINPDLNQFYWSLNLSCHQLTGEEFASAFFLRLKESSVSPCRIQIEMTETVSSRDVESAEIVLSDLAKKGVKVALDDFGVGYAAYDRIFELPLNKVKLDKSVIRGAVMEERRRQLVSHLAELLSRIGICSVVEGIETQEELDMVRLCNCDEAQGFFLGKPMNIDQVVSLKLLSDFEADGRKKLNAAEKLRFTS